MGWYRGLGRWAGAVLGAVALSPALALGVSAVLDRGPGGEVRMSLFPAALAALDDHVWECARNSLAVAAAVTFAARLVGVALARVAVRWRFWGRSPLVALACAGVVVPPAFGAIGLRWWFGPPETWAASTGLAWLGPWAGYLGWFWVALAAGAPLVGLASASSMARVEPLWEDAARLAGAGRTKVWRQFVWPVVRPDVARALALVFTLTLIEPGAPLVLGLRRTLGFQIAEAALDPEAGQFTRAAVLALAGVILAGLGRVLIGWWGGSKTPGLARVEAPVARARPASTALGGLFALILSVSAAVTWLPLIGVASASLAHGTDVYGSIVRDPLTSRYLINSAVLGVAVVALDLVLARVLAAWSVDRKKGRAADWPEMFPPAGARRRVSGAPVGLADGGRRLSGDGPAVVGR